MKRHSYMLLTMLLLTACYPVLGRDLMKQGSREVPFAQLREPADEYKGRLFILGGVIVDTRFTETGSRIEALYVPVDSYGNLKEGARMQGRFFAVYPRSRGLLDPVVYKKGREITLAGVYLETRKGRIDEMEYAFPVFEIREIYLWDEMRYYRNAPYYDPFYWDSPFLYDRFGRPFPSPFWPPPPW